MMTENSTRHELCQEAEFLHQKLFGWSVPKDIQVAFASANQELLAGAALEPVRIDLIRERSLDVEALEFALRRRNPENVLSKKLLILCYVVESRSAYFSTFVNKQHRPIRAFMNLSFATCRSMYKLVKGRCLIWMYDVV